MIYKAERRASFEAVRKASKIFPKYDQSFSDAYPNGISEREIRFHPVTNKFMNAPELEELYENKFIEENLGRSFKICSVFLVLYLVFTGSNLINLFSEDEKVRTQSGKYCLLVYPVMLPVPILLGLSRTKRFQAYFQRIYTIVVLCWSISFIAGGMHSMISEWFTYVEKDIVHLLRYLQYQNDVTTQFSLNRNSVGCNCTWWEHEPVGGSQYDVLFYYLGSILLPAATMNINLLRLIMVFIVVPLLKIDTVHYGFIVSGVSFTYCILVGIYYPTSGSIQFALNKVLVFCFPIILSVVMLLRHRDFERIVRVDFLHVWVVERAAELANQQKELIADENKKLKEELAEKRTNEISVDLESPIAKILQDLIALQSDPALSQGSHVKIGGILLALSRLDTNLFTPDINAQMNLKSDFDNDTKTWAMSVLGMNGYSRKQRYTANGNIAITSPKFTRQTMAIAEDDEINFLLPDVTPIEEKLLSQVRDSILNDKWDLDVIRIAEYTSNRPLYYVMTAICDIHSLFDRLKISRETFYNLMFQLDSGYVQNPYHSSTHAADVASAVNYLISNLDHGRIENLLTTQEFFAALLAAAIHDFRHPGKSNLFMVKTQTEVALQFSDSSVLERMHLAEAFFLIKDPSCNIFSGFVDKHYRDARKAIIEMVLSTDLSIHLQLVGNLKTVMLSEQKNGVANDPMMLMKVVVKCADIGHSAKVRHLHCQWSSLIIEEFFRQGDDERSANLSISPFMDRKNENSAKNQVGFYEFIVLPFYETVADVMFNDDFDGILGNIKANYKLWKRAVELNLTTIGEIQAQLFQASD